MSQKLKSPESNTVFPFKTVYFLGVRGLKTLSCAVYNYITSGHMYVWSIYVLYMQYMYISLQYTYISVQCIYLLLMH